MKVQKRRQQPGVSKNSADEKPISGETIQVSYQKCCCCNMQYTVLHGCACWVCCAARSGVFGKATSKEREQVLAHSDLFVGSAWYPEVEPHHWCKSVGIRREDSPGYVDAIATNVAGKNPSAFTLAPIEKSRNKIAGCVFCCAPDKDSLETLSVGHLKVDIEYQRRGLGTMLLAAAEIHAHQRRWRCHKARLTLLAENRPARNCYEKTGFQQVSSSFVELAEGIEHEVQWLKMARAQRFQGAGRGMGLGSASARTVDEVPACRRTDFLQIRNLEPRLKPRVCRNRPDMGQCLIVADMGRFRIHVGFWKVSGTGAELTTQVCF